MAGLLLQIQSMRDRNLPDQRIPAVEEQTPTTARILFTQESVQGLFDDLYDARLVEVMAKKKRSGKKKKLKAERLVWVKDKDGKRKQEKRFVYDDPQPRGYFLRQHLPDGENGLWHKLWRDMLWTIPRGNPQTQKPFEQRSEGKACKEGQDAWAELLRVAKARQKNEFYTTEISRSLWLGAQAYNAETVPFKGRAEQNLLLHFWPLAVLIFAPEQITTKGERKFVGYVITIPEVANLKRFLDDYPRILRHLGATPRGFRPAEAVISLPEEGALTFMEHLARLSPGLAEAKIGYAVNSVEYLHLDKFSKNIKMLASGRVRLSPDKLEEYRMLLGVDRPPPYRSPLFVNGLIHALISGKEWYEPFGKVLAEQPDSFFICGENPTRKIPWFWLDAANKFTAERKTYHTLLEVYQLMAADENTPQPVLPADDTTALALILEGMIRRYTTTKAKTRCNISDDKKVKDLSSEERKKLYEEKRKCALDAFLKLRSRHDQEFVNYLVEAVGVVGHPFHKDRGEYELLAKALTDQDQREKLKTLTLLALSANSWKPSTEATR